MSIPFVEVDDDTPFSFGRVLAVNELGSIPASLRAAAEAALAHVNAVRDADFHLTGLTDTEGALEAEPGEPIEFGIVLCQDDLCSREQVRVVPGAGAQAEAGAFEVSLVEADDPAIPPLLGPPIGVRSGWVDEQLAKHRFILLLFYRGRW